MSTNPDLSSVLRTLSAFANPSSTPPPSQQQQQPPTHLAPTSRSTPTPIQKPNTKQHPPPSQIVTWSPALKHIMHLTAQNQDFSTRIQHLIKSQREHERTWWKAREALIEKQAAREEKRRRIEEVLKSVGASSAGASTNATSPEGTTGKISQENATELKAYDSKVYQASLDMARAMETELCRLGVPFFWGNGDGWGRRAYGNDDDYDDENIQRGVGGIEEEDSGFTS
uniref:Auxin-induced protein AUX28 n=1 Tax=Talaromyces marneffei PM1 TaxID=1077442 RepID=A0A093Y3G8_TALMA